MNVVVPPKATRWLDGWLVIEGGNSTELTVRLAPMLVAEPWRLVTTTR